MSTTTEGATGSSATLPCGHDPIWSRTDPGVPGGCLRCAFLDEIQPMRRGITSLEALVLVQKHGLRVTFMKDPDEVVVERYAPDKAAPFDWLEVACEKTFLDAVLVTRKRLGLS